MKTKLLIMLLLAFAGMAWGQEKNSLDGYLTNPVFKDITISSENILRIEADLGAYWSGVRGCDDFARKKTEIEKVTNNWIKDKLFENKHLKWIRYGWNIQDISVLNGRNPFPDNSRYCSGTAKLKIYIEFENN